MSTTPTGQITQSEVTDIVRKLLLEGEEPSIRVIRERLNNRGSNTTIMKYKQIALDGLDAPERFLGQFPSRLEALCREMVDCLDGLASERVAAERQQLQALQAGIEERWNGLMLEKETAVQSFESEKSITADLRARLAIAEGRVETLAGELGDWKSRAAGAEALNAQVTESLEAAKEQVAKRDTQITHLEATLRVQASSAADELAATRESMQTQINSCRDRERQTADQLSDTKLALDRAESSAAKALSRAEQAEHKQGELNTLVADLSVELTESKKHDKLRDQQLNNALTAKDAEQSKVSDLQTKLIEAQHRIERLREDGTSEYRSVVVNLVDHARRVFELAQASAKKTNPELQELAIAQKEIERLFGGAGTRS